MKGNSRHFKEHSSLLGLLSPFGLVTAVFIVIFADLRWGVWDALAAEVCRACGSGSDEAQVVDGSDPAADCETDPSTAVDNAYVEVWPVSTNLSKFQWREFEDPENPFPTNHIYTYYRKMKFAYSYTQSESDTYVDGTSAGFADDLYIYGALSNHTRLDISETHSRTIEYQLYPNRKEIHEENSGSGTREQYAVSVLPVEDVITGDALAPIVSESAPPIETADVDYGGTWSPPNAFFQGVPDGPMSMVGMSGLTVVSSTEKELDYVGLNETWIDFSGEDVYNTNWAIYTGWDQDEATLSAFDTLFMVDVYAGHRTRSGSYSISLAGAYLDKHLFSDAERAIRKLATEAVGNPNLTPLRLRSPAGPSVSYVLSDDHESIEISGAFARVAIPDPDPRLEYEVEFADGLDSNPRFISGGEFGTDPETGRPMYYIPIGQGGVVVPDFGGDNALTHYATGRVISVRARPRMMLSGEGLTVVPRAKPILRGYDLDLEVGDSVVGVPLGRIRTKAFKSVREALDPAVLEFAGDTQRCQVIRDEQRRILQVKAPACLVDIEHGDLAYFQPPEYNPLDPDTFYQGEPWAPLGYTIRYYRINQVGGQNPDGTYQVSGEPFQMWDARNPVPDVNPAVQIRLTETRGASSVEYLYTHWPGTEEWTMLSGNLRQRYKVYTGGSLSAYTRITYHDYWNNATDELITRKTTVFKKDDFGPYRFAEIWGDGDSERWVHYEYTDGAWPEAGMPEGVGFGYRRLQKKVWSDGNWTFYRYDSKGEMTDEYSGFGDTPPPAAGEFPDTATCRWKHYGYSGPPSGADTGRPRTLMEYVAGKLVRTTTYDYEPVYLNVDLTGENDVVVATAVVTDAANTNYTNFFHRQLMDSLQELPQISYQDTNFFAKNFFDYHQTAPFVGATGKSYRIRYQRGAVSTQPGKWEIGRYDVTGTDKYQIGNSDQWPDPRTVLEMQAGYSSMIVADGGELGLKLRSAPEWQEKLDEQGVNDVNTVGYVTDFNATVTPGTSYRLYYLDGAVSLSTNQWHLGQYEVTGAEGLKYIGHTNAYGSIGEVETNLLTDPLKSCSSVTFTAQSGTIGLKLIDWNDVPLEVPMLTKSIQNVNQPGFVQSLSGALNPGSGYRIRYVDGSVNLSGNLFQAGTYRVAGGGLSGAVIGSSLEFSDPLAVPANYVPGYYDFSAAGSTVGLELLDPADVPTLPVRDTLQFASFDLSDPPVYFQPPDGPLVPGREYIVRYKEGTMSRNNGADWEIGSYDIRDADGMLIGSVGDGDLERRFTAQSDGVGLSFVSSDGPVLRKIGSVSITDVSSSSLTHDFALDTGEQIQANRKYRIRYVGGASSVDGTNWMLGRYSLVGGAGEEFGRLRSRSTITEVAADSLDASGSPRGFAEVEFTATGTNAGLRFNAAAEVPLGTASVNTNYGEIKEDSHLFFFRTNGVGVPAPTNGLIGHWEFEDDTNSTTAADSVGPNHDAVLNGASIQLGGRYGQALRCTGGYAEVLNSGALFNAVSNFTVSVWVKKAPNADGEMVIVSKHRREDESGYFMEFKTDDWTQFWLGNSEDSSQGTTPGFQSDMDDGLWHHWVGVYRHGVLPAESPPPGVIYTGTTFMYLDGREAGAEGSEGPVTNSHSVLFGAVHQDPNLGGGIAYPLDGWLDDVRVYSRALTPEEIRSIYSADGDGLDRRVIVDVGQDYRIRLATGAVGQDADGQWRLGQYTVKNDGRDGFAWIGYVDSDSLYSTDSDFSVIDALYRGDAWDVTQAGDQYIGLHLGDDTNYVFNMISSAAVEGSDLTFHLFGLDGDPANNVVGSSPATFEIFEVLEGTADDLAGTPPPTFELVEVVPFGDNSLGAPPTSFSLSTLVPYGDNTLGPKPPRFRLVEIKNDYDDNSDVDTDPATFELLEIVTNSVPIVGLKTTKTVTSDNVSSTTVTYRHRDERVPGRTRVSRIEHADGTITIRTFGGDALGAHSYTEFIGQPAPDGLTLVKGIKTLTQYGTRGELLSEETWDIAANVLIAREVHSNFDDYYRSQTITYLDGSTSHQTFNCCSLESSTDRSGVITSYSYDDRGRLESTTVNGVTRILAYDLLGRIVRKDLQGSDATVRLLETIEYDALNRYVAKEDVDQLRVEYSYLPAQAMQQPAAPPLPVIPAYGNGLILNLPNSPPSTWPPPPAVEPPSLFGATNRVTVTYPNLTTRVTDSHYDGSLKRVGGTAVNGRRYEYGSEPGQVYVKEIRTDGGGNDQADWVTRYRNGHGNLVKVVYADGTAATAYYDTKGQLKYSSDLDYYVNYEYDGLGELAYTFRDRDSNAMATEDGTPDFAANDMITHYKSFVGPSESFPGNQAIIQETYGWPEFGSNVSNRLSRVESVVGLAAGATIRYGDAAGTMQRLTKSVRVPLGNGDWKTTRTNPDGTYSELIESAGRLVSAAAYDSNGTRLGSRSYGYDAFGRSSTVTNSNTGATVTTYNPNGTVNSVTMTPVPGAGGQLPARTTTYAYDNWRRLEALVRPDGTTNRWSYYDNGDVKRRWGADTYPVEYTYDYAGRRKTLTTWKDFAADSGKAVTTWNYHGQRGWLQSKTYDSGKADTFSYSVGGRLVGISTAAGRTVGYDYHSDIPVVQFVNLDDQPNHDLEFDHDRMGRTTSLGTLSRTYNLFGQIESEMNLSAGAGMVEVRNSYDVIGRRSRMEVRDFSDTPIHGVDYGYDPAGRLAGVTNGTASVTYGYEPVKGRLRHTDFFHQGAHVVRTERTYDVLDRLDTLVTGPLTNGLSLLEAARISNVTVENQTVGFATPVQPGSRYRLRYRQGAVSLIDGTQWRVGRYNVAGADNEIFGDDTRYESPEEVEEFHAGLAVDVQATATSLGLQLIDSPGSYGDNQTAEGLGQPPSTVELLEEAAGPDPQLSFDYDYDINDRRTKVTREDGSHWDFAYDGLGQLSHGKRYLADGAASLGQHFEYDLDDVGNRKTTRRGGDATGGDLATTTYTADSLNQVTQRDNPGKLEILGAVTRGNPGVFVNYLLAQRQGDEYRRQLEFLNNVALWTSITNTAVLPAATTNGADAIAELIGEAYVPPAEEIFTWDDDGNLTSDGRWTYRWNQHNQLAEMETHPFAATVGIPKALITFGYDAVGRRTSKATYGWNGNGYYPRKTLYFVYDGPNLVAEISPPVYDDAVAHGSNLPNGWELKRTYTWGRDKSGSVRGANGVGGLLFISLPSQEGAVVAFAASDGRGNVAGLIDATSGAFIARYEYGPYGEVIRASGVLAKANPIRYSSRYTDRETGLLYYGHRYYSPETGLWLNRDPLGEFGGLNLTGFVGGDPVNLFDPDGRVAHWVGGAVVGGGLEVAIQSYQWYNGNGEFDLGDIAKGAALGAVGGGIGAKIARMAKLRRVGRLAAGAAAAGALNTADYTIDNWDCWNVDDALDAFESGAAFGALGDLLGPAVGKLLKKGANAAYEAILESAAIKQFLAKLKDAAKWAWVKSPKTAPNSLGRHTAWADNLDSVNATVQRLGERALRQSGGDWRRAEAIFEGYLKGVQNRFTRTGSKYGVEIQPAALADGTRVPAFIQFQTRGGGWTDRLYAFPDSRRLDAGIIDTSRNARGLGGSFHPVVSGFDITLDAAKVSPVPRYQQSFGTQMIFDIRQ